MMLLYCNPCKKVLVVVLGHKGDIRGVCGRAVNTSNSGSEDPWFKPHSLDKELYSTLSLLTQARVVQTLDSAIHRINHYPADKYWGN